MPSQSQLDSALDKAQAFGWNSLSEEQKRWLQQAGKQAGQFGDKVRSLFS